MKSGKFKLTFLIAVVISFQGIVISSSGQTGSNKMPDNVKSIIDKSCIGCHNSEAKNQAAKDKLNFSAYESLTNIQKIGKLKSISKTIEAGEMPPKRFVEKFPDKKLTAADITLINEWIKSETSNLKKAK